MEEFAMWGAGIGAVGSLVVSMMQGRVPGLGDLLLPAVGGMILAAIVFIFYAGTR